MKTTAAVLAQLALFLFLAAFIAGCAQKDSAGDSTQTSRLNAKLQFEEIGKGYDEIVTAGAVGDKLAFIAKKGDKNVMVYDGKEYGEEYAVYWETGGKPSVTEHNGKAAFIIKKGDKFSVIYDEKTMGGEYERIENTVKYELYNFLFRIGKPYSIFDRVQFIGGQTVFLAKKGSRNVVVYGGNELGLDYDSVVEYLNVDGKLAFSTTKGGKMFVIYDGTEIAKDYDTIRYFTTIGGEVAFIGQKGIEAHVVVGGKIIYALKDIPSELKRLGIVSKYKPGSNYELIDELIDAGGSPAFIVTKDGKKFVVLNNMIIGEKYDDVEELVNIAGKLAFIAKNGGKIGIADQGEKDENFVVFDGKPTGKEYDVINHVYNIGNKLAFVGEKINADAEKVEDIYLYSFVYDGKVIFSKPSTNIEEVFSIDGKPSFIIREQTYKWSADGKVIDYSVWQYIFTLENPEMGAARHSMIAPYGPRVEGSNIAFKSTKCERSGAKSCLIYNDIEIDVGYDYISDIFYVGKKVALIGIKCSKEGKAGTCYDYTGTAILVQK